MAGLPTRGCLSKARMRPRSPPPEINQEPADTIYNNYTEEPPHGHYQGLAYDMANNKNNKENWKCRFQLSPNWQDRVAGWRRAFDPTLDLTPGAVGLRCCREGDVSLFRGRIRGKTGRSRWGHSQIQQHIIIFCKEKLYLRIRYR